MSVQDQLWVIWWFIWRGNSGKVWQFTLSGQLVESLGVTLLADFDGGINKDLKEFSGIHQLAHLLPLTLKGRDERDQDNQACIQHQLGDFSDTSDIFCSVFLLETKIPVESVTYVISIE